MKRRAFLAASCFAGVAPLSQLALAREGDKAPAKQLIELRKYELEPGEKAERFKKFLGEVAVPALNRIGIKPVGAFRIEEINKQPQEGNADVYVVLPHCCFESVVTATARLLDDEEYLKAGAEVLDCPKNDPAFKRFETSLSLSFDDCPKLEVPSQKESRMLQLRIYESHSQKNAKMKVHMFNEGGEIALFRKVGLNPVFFGETLAGVLMPNLTYMLGFDSEEALKTGWDKFLAHPDWAKLKALPQYKDTVSRITNIILRPVAGSQV